jgi:hypothetical protein
MDIRFDPETGRLEGTNLPAIPEMIAAMKENGWRGKRCVTWLPEFACGCAIGIAAKMKRSAFGSPDLTETVDSALSIIGHGRETGTYEDVSEIANGFDLQNPGPLTHPAVQYGHAAYWTMKDEGLLLD